MLNVSDFTGFCKSTVIDNIFNFLLYSTSNIKTNLFITKVHKTVLKIFCILLMLLMQVTLVFADSNDATLSPSEADAIVALEESRKKARLASQLAKLEEAEALSEGEGTLSDGRAIIVREVAPPVPVTSPVVQLPTSPEPASSAKPQTEEELKPYETLMFSATVYDREVTRLSWEHEGESYVAYTNADFNCLQSIMDVNTESDHFSYFIGIGDASRIQNPYPQESIPALSAFVNDRSEYILQQGNPENIAATAGLEALLAYYDANLDTLKVDHQRNEALKNARQRYDERNPEEPEDFIMQFWVPEKASTE